MIGAVLVGVLLCMGGAYLLVSQAAQGNLGGAAIGGALMLGAFAAVRGVTR